MDYVPVLILMLIGMAVGVGALAISHFVGPKIWNKRKDQPFECGVPPIGDAQHRVSVRFYLVAILFLIFDVEVIFFFLCLIVFKKYLAINSFILIEMALFAAVLIVGYLYVLLKGALEWD